MTARPKLVLYSYWRSSASYRVRIALNLKNIEYDIQPVNLLAEEHTFGLYREINPQGLLPTLIDRNAIVSQSMAIMEYLEEAYPEPSLMPLHYLARARVRTLANIIACDVHPLQNLRVKKALARLEPAAQREAWWPEWCARWIGAGLKAYEEMLAIRPDFQFSNGSSPTIADCCLIPQVYNARRSGCDLTPFPFVRRVYDTCMQLEAFQKAEPENQPDAPTEK